MTALSNCPTPLKADRPWQRVALQRAHILYGSRDVPTLNNYSAFDFVVARAVRHSPYMIQALETFPALAVLAPAPLDLGAVARGERLWPLAERHGLRRQLRALRGPVVRHHCNVVGVRECRAALKIFWRLSPAELATLVPAHQCGQDYLLFLARFLDACYQDVPASNLVWLIRQCMSGMDRQLELGDLIDFMRLADRPFDSRWSLQRAMAECDAWHDRPPSRRGLALGTCADYDYWPLESVVGAYTFTALRSPRQLRDETRIMRHCVAAYADDVLQGRSRIYAVRGAGERATVEWRNVFHDRLHWNLTQIKGPCNGKPSDAIVGAVQVFIARLRIDKLRAAIIPSSTKDTP